MPRDDDAVHALIGEVYDAAFEPLHWPRVLHRIGEHLEGVGILSCFLGSERFALSGTVRLDPAIKTIMRERYVRPDTNVFIAALPRLPVGRIVARQDIVADTAYLGSDLYNTAFRPQGMRHVAISCLYRDHEVFVPFDIMCAHHRDPLDAEEHRFLGLVLQHLHNAVRLMVRTDALARRADALEDAWDHLAVGLALVDPGGRVSFANHAARTILDRRDGLCCQSGILRAMTSAEAKRLRELMAAAAMTSAGKGWHAGGALSVSRPSTALPYNVLVTPLGGFAPGRPSQPLAAVFISDPERPVQSLIGVLQQTFGLTRAESALVSHMLSGLGLNEAAHELGIKDSTVRTHLKRVFSKMGVSRQSDLIRRITDSAVWAASTSPGPALANQPQERQGDHLQAAPGGHAATAPA